MGISVMSNLEQEKISLCFDNEKFDLVLNDYYEISHSKIGEPIRMFKIRSKDTAPVLRATLLDRKENPIMITANNSLKLIMRQDFYYDRESEEIVVQSTDNFSIAPQNDPDNKGKFQYNWTEEDTAIPGTYLAYFKIGLNGVENQNVAPYKLSDGMTLDISIDKGATQTFTFNTASFVNINLATALEIVAVINTTITDGIAIASNQNNRILIQSLDTSDLGSVQILGGTSNDFLLFDTFETNNRTISLPEKGFPVKILEDIAK